MCKDGAGCTETGQGVTRGGRDQQQKPGLPKLDEELGEELSWMSRTPHWQAHLGGALLGYSSDGVIGDTKGLVLEQASLTATRELYRSQRSGLSVRWAGPEE
ncbi:hypothetical protein GGTG_06331 [Gaeumannomyces tritici R3-111a-1]|uniref:Uncharacterized protein n=1 Tax=Gaeumannomyces tritici (strain R3-111a-1) TaxID=644352 RepID=J3NYH9_GAET3|nr:hypothetical protein GGTG_06331 [Gaeumannomyces tritici R3-111a-1]EJT76412.1 hypothetical protein GGTG_06331 [Gaeumannomyces tritici R3-111a-1]